MPEALPDILEEIQNLEPLPQAALKVLSLSARPDVVPREVISVIQTDAALTARVLKLCNSAYYGFQREIASLVEAGNLLGINALVNLVLTACAGRYFQSDSLRPGRAALWERSVANALAASLLARVSGRVDKNRAYTAGLLQNMGMLVLDRFFEAEMDRLRECVEGGMQLIEAEQFVFGLHHAEVGARLGARWGFPDILVDTIRHHHRPDRATADPHLCAFVHLSERVTTRLAQGEGLESLAYDLRDGTLGLAGLDPTAFAQMEEVLTRELARAREFVTVD